MRRSSGPDLTGWTIAARYFDPGAYIKPGLPVVRIISTMGLRVRFALPEEETAAATMQASVDVFLDDGKRMIGRVEQIAPNEPASRTLFVEASLQTETTAAERAVWRVGSSRVSFSAEDGRAVAELERHRWE